jgi:hypothetical protein
MSLPYGIVPKGIWRGGLLSLGGMELAGFYTYLLSSTHTGSEGLSRMPLGYVVTDLAPAGVDLDEVTRCLAVLEDRGFIVYDYDAEVLFDPHALRTYPPTSPQQIKGAIRKLQQLPPTHLLDALYVRAVGYAPLLAEAMREEFPQVGNSIDSDSERSADTLDSDPRQSRVGPGSDPHSVSIPRSSSSSSAVRSKSWSSSSSHPDTDRRVELEEQGDLDLAGGAHMLDGVRPPDDTAEEPPQDDAPLELDPCGHPAPCWLPGCVEVNAAKEPVR